MDTLRHIRAAMCRNAPLVTFAILAAVAVTALAASAADVVSVSYCPDAVYPQLLQLWQPSWSLGRSDEVAQTSPAIPLGGYAFAYVRNTSAQPLRIDDLSIAGVKLSEALGKSGDRQSAVDLPGMSVLLSKLPADQIEKVISAGKPVWWKPDPRIIPPGTIGQVVIRLRHKPAVQKLDLAIHTDQGDIPCDIDTQTVQPRFEGIDFAHNYGDIYMYLRYPGKPGVKPQKILLDDRDITSSVAMAADPVLDLVPVVCSLSDPLPAMSMHSFRAIYPDGASATTCIRAVGGDFAYGMWGSRGEPKKFLAELAAHNVNVHMGHAGKEITEISLKPEGEKLVNSLGIRQMATWPGNAKKPLCYFLMDEPDAHDGEIDELESVRHLGCLGQGLVGRAETMRGKDPNTPILLNIDNTDTPHNWMTYHQLADIPSIDPYYPEQLDGAYKSRPGSFARNTRPSYVYAATRISQSAGAPKPLHVILCSTKYIPKNAQPGHYIGRYPTPEEKRMEVYYALAAGAKGISYWWFTPDAQCMGCGADDQAARALWKEIGLLGAEARTVGPVVGVSCPADLPNDTRGIVTVRSLVSGLDTVAVIAVNDDVLCDRLGTVVRPTKATVNLTLPAWLKAKDAFEITYQGTKDVTWKPDSGKVAIDLGTVDVGKMVIVTADTGLRKELQQLYDRRFATNVANLLSAPN